MRQQSTVGQASLVYFVVLTSYHDRSNYGQNYFIEKNLKISILINLKGSIPTGKKKRKTTRLAFQINYSSLFRVLHEFSKWFRKKKKKNFVCYKQKKIH